jgi:hypothetical protein
MQQLNSDAEVLQFSENTAMDYRSIEDVSTAPNSYKDNVVLAVIGNGSIIVRLLQDIGIWQIRISDSFRDFIVKRGAKSTTEQ